MFAFLAVATACGREPTPAVPSEVVGGVRVRTQENSIYLTAYTLRQSIVESISRIDGVSQVHYYLEVATEPNAIIGVSPRGTLLVQGETVSLASGEAFTRDAENVVIPGIRVNATPTGSA